MIRDLKERIDGRVRKLIEQLAWTSEARAATRTDRRPLPEPPDAELVIREGLRWLLRAQRESTSRDGGVARHYSFIHGWTASYPETTGYIVPTLFEHATGPDAAALSAAAYRMLDFLEGIQDPDGGWCGGVVGQLPQRPVTFNTGQILLGMAAGAARDARYRKSMDLGAEWLVRTQDADGAWRRHASPFAPAGDKVYDTHVAWGLLEAARVANEPRYAEAARRNIEWAMGHQNANGWFRDCCLTSVEHPLTHTLGYAIRGILEGYRYFHDEGMLRSARSACDSLGERLEDNGFLAGRFDEQWRPQSSSACLTGTSQIAICWLLLHAETGEPRYLDYARRANAFVRRTISVDGPEDIRGGVKGSHPVWGDYNRYQLLNWACKFTLDAQHLERLLTAGQRAAVLRPRAPAEGPSAARLADPSPV